MENLKITIKKAQKKSGQDRRKIVYLFFFHPDYTVGFGISPNQLLSAGRGLYRRWGISPRPEERYLFVR